MQESGEICKTFITSIVGIKTKQHPYYIDCNVILNRKIADVNKLFEVLVVPCVLTSHVLYQAHDILGHNGTLHS